MASNIFNYSKSGSSSNVQNASTIAGSVYTVDRLDLLTEDLAADLNTYRDWDDVDMYLGNVQMDLKPGTTGESKDDWKFDPLFAAHKKSLFNNTNMVMSDSNVQLAINAPLIDGPEMRTRMHRLGLCTVGELCRASSNGEMGREIYNFSDFMYCKHLGKVSNNYLVTLRRFPYPAGDFIGYIDNVSQPDVADAHMPDIGRLITWMGVSGNEMTNILKFDVNMPWTEVKSEMQEVHGQGDSGGLLRNFLNLGNPKYLQQVQQGRAGSGAFRMLNSAYAKVPGFGGVVGNVFNEGSQMQSIAGAYDHVDKNKVYGPVDSITKTMRRADPAQNEDGLQFNQEITLNFDYELRSYDGINPRAAMMDLLSNVLAVTYTTGEFWRGGFRATGPSDSSVFSNLPIFKYADSANPPTYKGVMDATVQSFQEIGRKTFGINEGDDLKGTLKKIFSTIGSGVFSAVLGGALNKLGRPARQALNSLVSPAPVGMWHLTIGNPKHPIMSMGNMILTKTDISFSGPLGLDDFPTNMRVSITLKHAKPRDNADIERMFMFGDYRIYTPMDKDSERVYKGSHRVKTKTHTSNTGKTGGVNAPEMVDRSETSADSPNQVASQETAAQSTDETSAVYMKYFGTKDITHNILWASQEAYLGSQEVTKDTDKGKDAATQNSGQS